MVFWKTGLWEINFESSITKKCLILPLHLTDSLAWDGPLDWETFPPVYFLKVENIPRILAVPLCCFSVNLLLPCEESHFHLLPLIKVSSVLSTFFVHYFFTPTNIRNKHPCGCLSHIAHCTAVMKNHCIKPHCVLLNILFPVMEIWIISRFWLI